MGALVKLACGALAAVLLAAAAAPAAARVEAAVQIGDVRFEPLDPQRIERGSCGMFVWLRNPAAKPEFILVAYDNPAQALVRANGNRRSLARVNFEGEASHGHFERQTFSDGAFTLTVDVKFDDDRPVQDGALIREGVLKLLDGQGWETIAPVGGMVACQR